MKRSLVSVTALLAALALMPALAQQPDLRVQPITSGKFLRQGARAIPNQYIVVLNSDAKAVGDRAALAATDAFSLTARFGGAVTEVYGHALNGFAAEMTEEEAIRLSQDPRVAFVEEDSVMEAVVTQNNPPWGLDRIGQRDLPLNATYSYTTTGAGVNAYIIDTGHPADAHAVRWPRLRRLRRDRRRAEHQRLQRSRHARRGNGRRIDLRCGQERAAVRRPRARVAAAPGSNSGVIAGVDWVTANHIAPAVANMSLGGGRVDRARHGGAQLHRRRA